MDSAMPRWQKATVVFLGVAILGVLVYLTALSRHGFAQQNTQIRESRRRDCITIVQTARRAVFDDVGIYTAIALEQTSAALLKGQQGIRPTAAEVDAFAENSASLSAALAEARRLLPAKTLDDLIDHGGMIAGVRYEACPAVR